LWDENGSLHSPVCGKNHATLAEQLQICVLRLALLELSAGPSCWGRCERVDRTLLEGVNRHRAGWHLQKPHLSHAITIMRRRVLRRAGAGTWVYRGLQRTRGGFDGPEMTANDMAGVGEKRE